MTKQVIRWSIALLYGGLGPSTWAQSWICDSPIMTDKAVVSSFTRTTVSFAYCAVPDCAGAGDTLKMNVYIPQTMDPGVAKPEKFPLMVFFSGGGFYTGDRNMVQWPEAFARRGYVVATPDYRVGWDRNGDGVIDDIDYSDTLVSGDCNGDAKSLMRAIMRASLDAHSVIRFILGDPGTYPVDPDLVYVGGPSAGGSLALTAAFADRQQMLDYWNQFTDTAAVEVEPCDMRYEVRDCPLLGPEYTSPYRIRGVVNCWGQAVIDPLSGDPGNVDLISFFGREDHVNPPGVGTVLNCDGLPLAIGSKGMHFRQVQYGHCVKTIEDPDARHKTVFLEDIDSANYNASLSARKGERANFIAQQANCLFKSSLCGQSCSSPIIYEVDRMADWASSYVAVNGGSRGQPNGCNADGSGRFQAILPPQGLPLGGLSLWPNPNSGNALTMAWDSPSGNGECTITDVSGRTVFSGRVKNRSALSNSLRLEKGYYWISVEDDQARYSARFLVVD